MIISIHGVSPEVVRDDECEALGGPQERTAGSRVADNTQQGALLISVIQVYWVEQRSNIGSPHKSEEKKAMQCNRDDVTHDVTTGGRCITVY